jgi:hypothetical protein
MKLKINSKLPPTSQSIQKVKFPSIQASPRILNLRTSILKKRMKSNLSQRLLMPQKIIKTIYNSKYLLPLEMMLSIWVLSTWDLPRVNQLELFSIPDPNILPSPLHYVMTRLQETSSSRSTTHSQAHSFRETN